MTGTKHRVEVEVFRNQLAEQGATTILSLDKLIVYKDDARVEYAVILECGSKYVYIEG